MNIREATAGDLKEIIKIHVSSFDNFFLTSLGDEFLEIYYKAYINNPAAILLCIEDSCRVVVGFAAAATESIGFNKKLILHTPISFLFVSIKLMFSTPRAILRILKNFTKRSDVVEDDGDYAELFSIAVAPNKQGMGVGKKLLTQLESVLKSKGATRVSLTTDLCDNDATVCFYKSMGYRYFYDFVSYPQRRMLRLIKNLK